MQHDPVRSLTAKVPTAGERSLPHVREFAAERFIQSSRTQNTFSSSFQERFEFKWNSDQIKINFIQIDVNESKVWIELNLNLIYFRGFVR